MFKDVKICLYNEHRLYVYCQKWIKSLQCVNCGQICKLCQILPNGQVYEKSRSINLC